MVFNICYLDVVNIVSYRFIVSGKEGMKATDTFNPFITYIHFLMPLRQKTLENIIAEGEIAYVHVQNKNSSLFNSCSFIYRELPYSLFF